MWETLVLAGLAIVLGVYIYFRLRRPVHRSSVMAVKYKALIDRFVAGKQAIFTDSSHKSVHFKIREGADADHYTITEVDGKLIIVWSLNSKVHGKRGKEWSFNLPAVPGEVYDTVNKELELYRRTLYRE